MFGTKQVCEETRDEVRVLRMRLDELTGRSSPPPMSANEFLARVDELADTPKQRVGRPVVGRVVNVTFDLLRSLHPQDREAMIRELLKP